MEADELKARIEALVRDPSDLRGAAGAAVDEVIAALDVGALRVCEPAGDGWVTHAWIKEAILLYFRRLDVVPVGGHFGAAPDARGEAPSYFDRLPTKRNYDQLGARCVPPGVARVGPFLGWDLILIARFIH